MKKLLLMLSVIGVITISSCSKDMGGSAPEELKGCTLTSSTYSLTHNDSVRSQKTNYTYNKYYKISGVIDYEGNSIMSNTYTYDKNRISSYSQYNNAPDYESHFEQHYQLDDKGRIVSISDPGNRPTIYYSYNAEGFLATIRNDYFHYVYNLMATNTQTFSYTNGNLTKIVNEDSIGQYKILTGVSNIFYTTDRLKNDIIFSKLYSNLFSGSTGNLTAFLGKRSKNLPSKIVVQHSMQVPDKTTTIQYNYQRDAKENIIGIKVLTSSIPFKEPYYSNEEYKFAYDCN